ncbi:MAG TPA: bifunctional riboflavin kinase/FAD synthetase [Vicinamibacteria bacterium]
MTAGRGTMRISYYPDVDLRESRRPAVTLGNFDGVHLGHQKAFALLRERAKDLRAPSVAVTFEPHPVSVLRPERAPKRILTPKQKQEVIAAQGIDHLVVIHFTKEFSQLTAEEFVERVLVRKLRAAELVLGANFRFGRGREGDLESLRKLGVGLGFVVHQVEAARYGGEILSSSRIRKSLEEGAVDEAKAMLGRPHFLEGQVVRGDGRGKLMGFPTANMKIDGDVLAADGVYVTEATVSGAIVSGMTHVGRRPTFGLEERTVETHLFDFERDLYGARIRLHFHHRIRGTVKFSSAEALQEQLRRDREEARGFLGDLRARGGTF